MTVFEQQPYQSEDLLQLALARFPEVIAGHTTSSGGTGALLLVKREMGVPKALESPDTWSVDHLFIDADSVPVVVEVKRSSDTRIRREVVGQMLDYAANGVRYWPVERLRSLVDEAAPVDKTGDQVVSETLGVADVDAFWADVGTNLEAGKIRLLFVADLLPEPLVRVIEFLNEQMRPAEVLGIELPQYIGGGHQVLVPRVVGRTRRAVNTKTPNSPWTRESFIAAIGENFSDDLVGVYERLFEHAKTGAVKHHFGTGASPGVSLWYSLRGGPSRPLWYASAGTAMKNPKPTFSFYCESVRSALSDEEFTPWIQRLSRCSTTFAEALSSKVDSAVIGEVSVDARSLIGSVDEILAVMDAAIDKPEPLAQ